MKKLLNIFLFAIILCAPLNIFASYKVAPALEKAYIKFSTKLERQKWEEVKKKKLIVLYNKLNKLIDTKKYTPEQVKLLGDLKKLINEDIFQDKLDKQYLKGKIQLKQFPIVNTFSNKLYNEEYIFLENWVWYSYFFTQHLYFDNTRNISSRDLEHNGIDAKKDLVFLSSKWKLWFATEFKKKKLIKDSLIFWLPNKFELLTEIRDDKISLSDDTDLDFLLLKNITKKLTDGKTEKVKIELIYDYVLSNVEYTRNINLNDKKIFSWIHTYKNKDWVCEWYTKVLLYMLTFADIRDVEVIRGYVIDAQDFPQIWHAWVRVKNMYFDPTFDDPITTWKTKQRDEYKYFNLPKDLFYTNRYDYWYNIDHLKSLDLETRKAIVVKNLSHFIDKYKSRDYNLLSKLVFKKENNISLYSQMTISDLSKVIPTREVKDFLYKEQWRYIRIESLNFYPITDATVERLLNQVSYNLDGYELHKWEKEDKTFEYRLAYDIHTK